MARKYNPKSAYFVKGDKKVKGSIPDVHITDLKQLTVKDWAGEYRLFISPTKRTSSAEVYGEYIEALKQWSMKNPDGSIHDARKAVGIMLTADGREAITNARFPQQVVRPSRERQQKHIPLDEQGKPIPARQRDAKFKNPRQQNFLREVNTILDDHFGKGWLPPEVLEKVSFEGHHVKGVASLNKFFSGANDDEAFELRQAMINKGFTAGESNGNFAWLSPEQHELAHKIYGEDYDFEVEGKKGVAKFGETDFPRSKEISDEIDAAPFKRDPLQQNMLDRGEDVATVEKVTGKKVPRTRKEALEAWIDLTGDEFNKSVEKAIRANPVKGLDPELQILANKQLANKQIAMNAKEVLIRDARKLNVGKLTRGLGKSEAYLRLAAGDYVGGTMGLAMQTDTFRNKVLKELIKRGGKSAAKLMPGVGVTMGALETAGYAAEGRFTQSAIAAFGAAAGEIPGIGDLIQGGTDLLNTGIDIATGNFLPDANLDDEYLDYQRQLTRGIKTVR